MIASLPLRTSRHCYFILPDRNRICNRNRNLFRHFYCTFYAYTDIFRCDEPTFLDGHCSKCYFLSVSILISSILRPNDERRFYEHRISSQSRFRLIFGRPLLFYSILFKSSVTAIMTCAQIVVTTEIHRVYRPVFIVDLQFTVFRYIRVETVTITVSSFLELEQIATVVEFITPPAR